LVAEVVDEQGQREGGAAGEVGQFVAGVGAGMTQPVLQGVEYGSPGVIVGFRSSL
jgi:hypothetical protein